MSSSAKRTGDDTGQERLDGGGAGATRPARTDARGEVIGRVVPRTTLRPAAETCGDADATDERLGQLMRRTDPRTDGDAPSVERVRVSQVDAVGTAGAVPPEACLDRATRAQALVDELRQCGPGDEQAALEPMRHLGDVGLAALAAGFPGLMWFDRRLPHRKIPRGRDASPLCSLLVQLGAPAIPVVTALLEGPDAEARFYAVLVASDMVGARPDESSALLVPLAARAFDEDADVRAAALEGLTVTSGARATAEAAAFVRAHLDDPRCSAFHRIAALRAVLALKDPRAVALLPPLLGWVERDVVEVAHEALRRITAEDLGADAKRWQRWVKKHGQKGRAEWLVMGLGHAARDLRAYAHAELTRLLGDDGGYRVEMGAIDRLMVQRRLRRLARERGLDG